MQAVMPQSAQSILKNVFGYDEFRPLQKEIIDNVLAKRDTLVIMPTGGGKSLCYQIPALLFDGLTVVVSPLISLMKDQVEQLKEAGVAAEFLNSSLSAQEYERIRGEVQAGKVKLLYAAPEGLLTERMLSMLKSQKVECLTIDEAHCISEWGHDFRPEYRRLVEVRRQFPDAVCIALTATATPRVQKDITETLGFEKSNEFVASFNRENLFLQVRPKTDPARQTVQFLEQHPNQSGIIYCFSRRQVDELAAWLASHNYSVLPYHAGLTDEQRRQNQELFIRDDVQIIVATIAFGMGINKPNVRFVIHYDLPKNIESYYQEIGRAGRDGLRADCLLLFSYGDQQKIRYFIDQKEEPQERRNALHHLEAMMRYAETDACRRTPLLTYFGENYTEANCGMCDNCVEEKKALVDVTVAAQKFLSCVKRTREIFGANHIIDVLRGSENKKVLDFGHHKLPTYGVGREYSRRQWQHLARQFLAQDLLFKDVDYGSLKITEKGADVLFREAKVFGRLEEQQIAAAGGESRHDERLFTLLRQKRKQLADRQNVPPYVIFSDRALIEMATLYPQSRQSFLAINGVGEVKLNRYGNVFLTVIRNFCEEHNIAEGQASMLASNPTPRAGGKKRFIQIGEAFQAGKSIADLIQEFHIKRSTIVRHLFDYIKSGNALPPERVLAESKLSPQLQKESLAAFERLGGDYLTPVFEALRQKASYDELHIMRIYYLSKKMLEKQ